MAALGAVGIRYKPRTGAMPSSRDNYGALSITGTAQVNGTNTSVRLDLFDERKARLLYRIDSHANGTFTMPNLAAGRYVVDVDGRGNYRPKSYVVTVS